MRCVLALALPVALAACAEKLPEAHVMPLVGAERNFGREVAELGMVDGFTRNLAADAVLLRPEPQPAAQALAGSSGSSGVSLTWEPAFAEIAASGDLGYTTGPYQAQRRDSAEVKYGHYVSVWRKEGERWRLVVDGGSPHPPPLHLPDRFTHAPVRVSANSADRAAELKSMRAAEAALIADITSKGLHALVAAAAPDLRYYPPGSFPITGTSAFQTTLLNRADVLTFTPRGDGVSAAGDLGYVWGDATRVIKPGAAVERGGYLRLWRRDDSGHWQLALDLTITEPARTKTEPEPASAAETPS
ncbi:nuclear transport factor 2 family protein [Nannocystis sp. SCPEA4]|uniref:nuclear transport factor 2 family protein n=1 Tax=Nannocystis sp. SCPEA4 TaxID=2996787 RepID=UPI002271D27B|nr:nuclear transport factor 2 family protein [Nannocystis sp. SCPEA4]MCY1056174.1 nuclear transport factor 2 family protein [Nannocystis sp. SCPEA4]